MPEAQPAPAAPESSPPPPSGGSGQPAAGSEGATQPANGNGAGAAPKSPATLLDKGAADETIAAPADWPEDWRDRMSGGDAKALERLARFKSPLDVFKSYTQAEAKIRSAAPPKPALSEKPTDEEIAEYRKAHGIPEKADGYKLDGEFTDDDKPTLDSFLQAAHSANMTPDVVAGVTKWYKDFEKSKVEADAQAIRSQRVATMTELQAEWGAELKPNFQALGNYLDNLPGNLGDEMRYARGTDGLPLGNNPEFIRWLVGKALDENPAATFVAGDGTNKNMASRKAELEKMMATDINKYHKEGYDKEYGEIVAREFAAKQRGRS